MKLLYLYVNRHRCLQELSVNFTGEYKFYTSHEGMPCGTLAICCEMHPELAIPDDFWRWSSLDRDSGEDSGIVENVNAIIGVNGSGKTSIASTFYNISHPVEDAEGRAPHYICIYEADGKYICMHGDNWKLNVDKLPSEIRDNLEYCRCSRENLPFDFIYYSPYTTTEHTIQSFQDSIIDVSTGAILQRIEAMEQVHKGSLFPTIAFLDYSKIFRFLDVCQKVRGMFPKEMPRPLPVSVEIKANGQVIDALRHLLAEYKNHRRYKLVFPSFGELGAEAIKIATCNCFIAKALGTFLCAILVGDHEAILGYDDNDREVYSFIKEIATAVSKYINLLSAIDEVACFEGEKRIDNRIDVGLHEMIESVLRVLSKDVNFDLYCSRHSICKDELVAVIRLLAEWYDRKYVEFSGKRFNYNRTPFFYVQEEDDLKWISNFATHLYRIGRDNNFLRFTFMRMSSGEMAYLTMLARLYAVVSGSVDEEYGETSSTQKEIVLYLDEAETTLHPEWQRFLVYALIWFVSKFATGKSVHLIFASHSPVLLSDIPKSHAIFLAHAPRCDFPSVVESACDIEVNTFGNNIFDLYRYVFTRDNGAVGAFASRKITEALNEVAQVVKARNNGDQMRLSAKAESVLGLVGDCGLSRYLEDLRAGGLI